MVDDVLLNKTVHDCQALLPITVKVITGHLDEFFLQYSAALLCGAARPKQE